LKLGTVNPVTTRTRHHGVVKSHGQLLSLAIAVDYTNALDLYIIMFTILQNELVT